MTLKFHARALALILAGLSVLFWWVAAAGEDQSAPISQASAPLATVIPNDPCFSGGSPCSGSGQWNLPKIQAPEAWSYTTGSEAVVIAILDTGIDLDHPDLASKLWVNPGEIAGNGLDDDGNGYVDDVYGYDFANSDPDPSDDGGWGTLMAGIASAATNNGQGIAGTVWGARLMAVKVFVTDQEGNRVGEVGRIAAGIRYAAENGARIINMSFWNTGLSQDKVDELRRAVEYAHDRGVLLVAAVGSGDENSEPRDPPTYPAALPYVIGVTATNEDDVRVGGARRGEFVDIAAPGHLIFGTFLPPVYYWPGTGTEFAAPQVAGLAALAWSIDAAQTNPDAIWGYIRAGADKVGEQPYDANGWNEYYGYGRINAQKTLLNTPHWLQVTPGSLTFVGDGTITPSIHYITNTSASAGAWTAVADAGWLALEGPVGNTPSQLRVSVVRERLPEPHCGALTASIRVDSTLPLAINSPRTIEVLLRRPACPTLTPTITPTPTPSPSRTPTSVVSPTPTATPTTSRTPTPSATPSGTASPTITLTPSPSPTATLTLVPPPTIVTTPPKLDWIIYLPLLTQAG